MRDPLLNNKDLHLPEEHQLVVEHLRDRLDIPSDRVKDGKVQDGHDVVARICRQAIIEN